MEAENKIIHFYSSLFHGDKDSPWLQLSTASHCDDAVSNPVWRLTLEEVEILTQETSASILVIKNNNIMTLTYITFMFSLTMS